MRGRVRVGAVGGREAVRSCGGREEVVEVHVATTTETRAALYLLAVCCVRAVWCLFYLLLFSGRDA